MKTLMFVNQSTKGFTKHLVVVITHLTYIRKRSFQKKNVYFIFLKNLGNSQQKF